MFIMQKSDGACCMNMWPFFFDQKRPDYSLLGSEIRLPEELLGSSHHYSSLLWRFNRAPFDPAGVSMRRS